MLGWIARILFVAAGLITSWFVAQDALNFTIIQMVISIFLFTLILILITFWQELSQWVKQIRAKYKKS